MWAIWFGPTKKFLVLHGNYCEPNFTIIVRFQFHIYFVRVLLRGWWSCCIFFSPTCRGRDRYVNDEFDLDLTYITERIIGELVYVVQYRGMFVSEILFANEPNLTLSDQTCVFWQRVVMSSNSLGFCDFTKRRKIRVFFILTKHSSNNYNSMYMYNKKLKW